MSSQRYEPVRPRSRDIRIAATHSTRTEADNVQVSADDQEEDQEKPQSRWNRDTTPSSPPPSFRSRASSLSSRHLLSSEDPIASDAERTLADTFDDGSDSDDDNNSHGDDRQRLMHTTAHQSQNEQQVVHSGDRPPLPSRTVTQFPGATPSIASAFPAQPYTGAAPFSSFSHSNDGVFANLNAKPERGEKVEEQPPVSIDFSTLHFDPH